MQLYTSTKLVLRLESTQLVCKWVHCEKSADIYTKNSCNTTRTNWCSSYTRSAARTSWCSSYTRSAAITLDKASSPLKLCLSTSSQPPCNLLWVNGFFFWHTVKKYPSHYMIYQKNTVHAATLRHNWILFSSVHFYLWRRVHSGRFPEQQNASCLKSQLHLDAPVPKYFSCYTDSIPVLGSTTMSA